MASCFVNRFPPVTRYALSAWARHPVPFALGEVRKLCVIDEPTRVGHRELIGFAAGIAESGNASTDTPTLPTACGTSALAAGLLKERVPVLLISAIRYPAFERLSPGVVIRRRPQRLHPSGSATRRSPDQQLDEVGF